MKNTSILKHSLAFSAGAVLYVALIATLLQQINRIVGPQEDHVIAPMAFLLLLTVSAATMGMLVFGKPVMLYLDGKKREAVTMVISTIACLAVFVALLFTVIALSA